MICLAAATTGALTAPGGRVHSCGPASRAHPVIITHHPAASLAAPRSLRACSLLPVAASGRVGGAGGARAVGDARQPREPGDRRRDGAVGGGERVQHAARCRCAAAATRTSPAASSRAPRRWRASRASFDPLAATLALARAQGLRVHAWVNVNLTSSGAELPASREHVVYEHPEWLMVPRALAFELGRIDPRSPEYVGRLARWTRSVPTEVEGLYSSPVHPGAVDRAGGRRRRARVQLRARRPAPRLRAISVGGVRLQPRRARRVPRAASTAS